LNRSAGADLERNAVGVAKTDQAIRSLLEQYLRSDLPQLSRFRSPTAS
jgi:hypothetical protein